MSALIDIGVNLAHDSFDADRDAVVERASQAGVTRMIITGTSVTASARAVELCDRRPGRHFATAGIHPHHADEFDSASIEALGALLEHGAVVAVGECGLDFFRDFSARPAQFAAFEAQLELAADRGLPVFLHQREAHGDFVRLLRAIRPRLAGGVAHCFTGGVAELEDYLELDLHVGITGWLCDERRADALRSALPRIPLDRLLLETDAPYLLPRDLNPRPRSRRNEPVYLAHVLQRVSTILGLPADAVADATTRNAARLFSLPPVGVTTDGPA